MTAQTNGKIWHDDYPALGTEPVPIEPCISSAYFEQERKKVFGEFWLNVGRVDDIPNPGDYYVKDLPVCRTSVLVVRGKDGQVRAFHNICSHRGNKVVWDQGGSCQAFSCKFHGWTYTLEGTLRFVPDEANFFDLDKNTLGLTPLTTDTWEGFIFIHLSPQPKQTLQEHLDALGQGLVGYPFEKLRTCYSWTTEINANWKVIKDAFHEAYHVPFLHKRSLPDSFTSRDNPFAHAFAFALYERNHRMSVFGNPGHQPSPVELFAHQFGSSIVKRDWDMDQLPPGVNPTRSRFWAFDANMIFPNFDVFVFDGTYLTHHFWPLAAGRTLWEVRTYFPQAANAAQRFSQEYSKILLREALLEDASTLEATQSMLTSGAKTHFVLQDQELLVRHAHKVIEDIVGFYDGATIAE